MKPFCILALALLCLSTRIYCQSAAVAHAPDIVQDETPRWNIGGGILAGQQFVYPFLHAQVRLEDGWSAGLLPSFFLQRHGLSQVTGVGLLATTSYSVGGEAFRGLGATVGAGFQSLALVYGDLFENPWAWIVRAQLDYNTQLSGSPWSVGVSVGMELLALRTLKIQTGYAGWHPIFQASLSRSL